MARLAAAVIVFAGSATALTGVPGAQELARLHVKDFSLAADRGRVRVGEPFHVTLTAQLAERMPALDNVTLPNLASFEELGDERNCSAAPGGGTACVETLTLDATQPGDETIGPASLAAIDARTGRPSRFITGTLEIHVAPERGAAASSVRDTLYGAAADVLRFALIALFLAVAGFGLWRLRPRAPFAAATTNVHPGDGHPPAAKPESDLAALVAALAREPTRERVAAVRGVLRARANARDEETLGDLVARRALTEPTAAAALAAVERAAFCEETQIAAAVREALPYLR